MSTSSGNSIGCDSARDSAQLGYALDILAIQQVIARYALGQDSHQGGDNAILEQWDDVFTTDGTVDYSASGGPRGTYRELALQMRGHSGKQPSRMSGFAGWQHMLSLPTIGIKHDRAQARTDFMAVHRVRDTDPHPLRLDSVGAFHDTLVRTDLIEDRGWRVSHRRLEVYFTDYVRAAPAEEYS